jgi:hypothetical protein
VLFRRAVQLSVRSKRSIGEGNEACTETSRSVCQPNTRAAFNCLCFINLTWGSLWQTMGRLARRRFRLLVFVFCEAGGSEFRHYTNFRQ